MHASNLKPPSYASQQSEPRFTTTVAQSPMPLATSPPLSTFSLAQSSSCVTSMIAAGTTTSVDNYPEFTATFVSPVTSPVLVCAIPKTLFAETSAGSTAASMPSNSQAFGSSGTHRTPNALTVVLGTLSAVLFVVILALGVLIRRKSAHRANCR